VVVIERASGKEGGEERMRRVGNGRRWTSERGRKRERMERKIKERRYGRRRGEVRATSERARGKGIGEKNKKWRKKRGRRGGKGEWGRREGVKRNGR